MQHALITRYSSASKWFHWIIAVIVITLLTASFFLEDLAPAIKPTAIMIHKSFGMTVLFLMLMRIIWILYAGRPALPTQMKTWEKLLAHVVQKSFYVLLIAMPVVGWMMSTAADRPPRYFGLFSLPLPWVTPNKQFSEQLFTVHQTIAFILIGLLILHVLGALKHHFIDKDDVLHRMLPKNRSH